MSAQRAGSLLLFVVSACRAPAPAPISPEPSIAFVTANPVPVELAPQQPTGPHLPDGCATTELDAQQVQAYLQSLPELPAGSLDRELLRLAMERHDADVRACYLSALATTSNLSGRVELEFVIAADGSVPVALVKQSAPSLHDVGCCITQYIRSWTFDRPEGHGHVKVTHPYVLNVETTSTGQWTRITTPDDPSQPQGALTLRQQIETEATHEDALSRCYETTLGGARPKLLLVLQLRVSTEGHVTWARVNSDMPEALRSCVADHARSWQFPRARLPSDFPLAISFPRRPRP